jgi:hypothetical protein
MKCPWFAAAIAAVLLMLASTGTPIAGVVMAETSIAQGPNGETFSVKKTVYLQGNKEKVEGESVAEITDLDKNLVYITDKHRRVYTEIPLQSLSSGQPANAHGEAILTKTGETRIVADHPCHEYRAVGGNKLEHVTISACVSTDVPGAKEIAEFDRNVITRLGGHTSGEGSIGSDSAGLMLEKQSVLTFRLPDPLRDKAYHTTSLIAATRVNKIQLTSLSPETFTPPVGYSKLQNRPRGTPPADSPDSDEGLEVIAPDLLSPSWLTIST